MLYNFNMRRFSILALSFFACTISSIQAFLNCNNPSEKDNVLIQNDFLWKKCKDGKVTVEACIIKSNPEAPAEYFTADQLKALYLNITGKSFLEDGDERLDDGTELSITSFCAQVNRWSQMSPQYFDVVKQLLYFLTQTTVISLPSTCQIKTEGNGKVYAITGRHDWSQCENGELIKKKCLLHSDETNAKCITRSRAEEILKKPDDEDYDMDLCSDFSELFHETRRAMKAKHLAPNCFDDSASDEVFLYLFDSESAEDFDDKLWKIMIEQESNVNPSIRRPNPFLGAHERLFLPPSDVSRPWKHSIPKRPFIRREDGSVIWKNKKHFEEPLEDSEEAEAEEYHSEEEEPHQAPVQRRPLKTRVNHINSFNRLPEMNSEETSHEEELLPRKIVRRFGPKIGLRKPEPTHRRRLSPRSKFPRRPLNHPFPSYQVHQEEEDLSEEDSFIPFKKSIEFKDSFEIEPFKDSFEIEPIKDDSSENYLEKEQEDFFKGGHIESFESNLEEDVSEENDHQEVEDEVEKEVEPIEDDVIFKEDSAVEFTEQHDKIPNEDDKIKIMDHIPESVQIAPVPEAVKGIMERMSVKDEANEEKHDVPNVPTVSGKLPNELDVNPKFKQAKVELGQP